MVLLGQTGLCRARKNGSNKKLAQSTWETILAIGDRGHPPMQPPMASRLFSLDGHLGVHHVLTKRGNNYMYSIHQHSICQVVYGIFYIFLHVVWHIPTILHIQYFKLLSYAKSFDPPILISASFVSVSSLRLPLRVEASTHLLYTNSPRHGARNCAAHGSAPTVPDAVSEWFPRARIRGPCFPGQNGRTVEGATIPWWAACWCQVLIDQTSENKILAKLCSFGYTALSTFVHFATHAANPIQSPLHQQRWIVQLRSIRPDPPHDLARAPVKTTDRESGSSRGGGGHAKAQNGP